MQTMGVTGKVYGIKTATTSNGKSRVTFRVGVRKRYVSDADKQNNATQTFIPCVANGPTADFISQYFKDGDLIAIYNMEYQTYKKDQNAQYDDAHIFKVDNVGFVAGGNDGSNAGQSQGGNNNARSNNNSNNNRPANNNARSNNGGNSRPAGRGNAAAQEQDDYVPSDDLPF